MIAAALALLARIPWQAWTLAAVIAAAGLYHWRAVDAAYDRGAADYRAKVEAANKASTDKADRGEAAVRACQLPMRWNRGAGRCEQ